MKRLAFELTEMSRFLDWLITHACDQSKNRGDEWDNVADDMTDAREKLLTALTIARGYSKK